MGERGNVLLVSGGPIEAVGPRRVRRVAVRVREGDFERAMVYATYDHLATGRIVNGARLGEDERAWTLFRDADRSEATGSIETVEVTRREVTYAVRDDTGTTIGVVRRTKGAPLRLAPRGWAVEPTDGAHLRGREGRLWAWSLYLTLGLVIAIPETLLSPARVQVPGQVSRPVLPRALFRFFDRLRPHALDLRATSGERVLRHVGTTNYRASPGSFPTSPILLAAFVLLHEDDRKH